MASRRGVHAGGSYGRVQAVVNWTLNNFRDFDAWCLLQGVDPLELPCYRFYNLVLYHWMDEKADEYREALENELRRVDNVGPFDGLAIQRTSRQRGKVVDTTTVKANISKPANPSVGEQPAYVPSWWRGDNANYAVAKKMMVQLPKELKRE